MSWNKWCLIYPLNKRYVTYPYKPPVLLYTSGVKGVQNYIGVFSWWFLLQVRGHVSRFLCPAIACVHQTLFSQSYSNILQGNGYTLGEVTLSKSLRKHAYLNTLNILQTKKEKFQIKKKFRYFSYFCSKHRLWVLVEAVLTSTTIYIFEQK